MAAVLAALNDPPEGEPRVEKTYSENTPPRQFRIDTDGLTGVYLDSARESRPSRE